MDAHLKPRVMLFMSAAVKLACKASGINLSTNRIIRVLRMYQVSYREQQIKNAERAVFRANGFAISLWTNMDKANKLAQELNLSDTTIKAVLIMMDFTDFHREKIQMQIQIALNAAGLNEYAPSVFSPPAHYNANFGRTGRRNVRNLFLIAGVLAAATSCQDHAALVKQIAAYVRISYRVVACLGFAISTYIKNFLDKNDKKRREPPTQRLAATKRARRL